MKSKQIEFPDCWEEVTPHEWVYLLKLRSKLIRLQGVTIDDVKRMCGEVIVQGKVGRVVRERTLPVYLLS